MASTPTEVTPQTPAKCQFCDVSTEIHWNCITCNVYFCNLCSKNIHSKIQSITPHHVINLKDYNSEKHAALCRQHDLENMTCSSHNGQKCISYCSDCQKLICFDCFKESHVQHQTQNITKLHEEEISFIKDLREKVDSTLPLIKVIKTKLQLVLGETNGGHEEIVKKIKAQETNVVSAVKKYSKELIDTCTSIYKPTKATLQEELDKTEKNEHELVERKDEISTILLSKEVANVFDSSKTLKTELPQMIESKITVPCTEFIAGSINDAWLSDTFGEIFHSYQLKVVQTYHSDLINLTSIVNIENDRKIIGSFGSEKIQQIKIEDDKIQVIKEENIEVFDMAMMDNGDLLISSLNTELRLYTKDGPFKSYKDFSPLETAGVHVNERKEILVGLAEPGSYAIKPNSIRRVVVINQTGEIIHSYEYDQDNQRLFMWPRRITTMNDYIYVIDRLNDKFEGRVVVLGYGGQVKWIYTGGDKEKSGVDKFYPCDITATTSGLILVSDKDNHRIHVLSQKGDLVFCHRVKDLGIELPLGIVIDDSGYLWIGCNTWRNDKPPKAKLHKLKFT